MGEKKSIEELEAEAQRLRTLKANKDKRAALEKEVKDLRIATGQMSIKRKVAIGVFRGLKSVSKTVQSDLDGSWQENEKKKKAQKNGQSKA
jgi:hypothetical protein